MRLRGHIYIPNIDSLRELVHEEAHGSWYFIHPGITKMYCDLTQHYWWRKMKADIAGHVSWCFYCQQAKYEHPNQVV